MVRLNIGTDFSQRKQTLYFYSSAWLLSFSLQLFTTSPICLCPRLKDVQSLDELNDVYNHFLLYYGRDVPKMQNAIKVSKKKKKLKKIIEVNEDGKAHASPSYASLPR